MSQMSVATTLAKRSATGQRRTALRVVTPEERTGSVWFPVLCVGLLLAGLAAVLTLNTLMAQDSFEVTALEARTAELTDTEAALEQSISSRSSPQNLAEEALALGMVPNESAAFIDVEKGSVLGVATVAAAPEGFTVDAGSTATVEQQKGDESSSDKPSDEATSESQSESGEGSTPSEERGESSSE